MLTLNRLNRFSLLQYRCFNIYCYFHVKKVRKPSVNPAWTDSMIYGMAILDVNRIEAPYESFLTL